MEEIACIEKISTPRFVVSRCCDIVDPVVSEFDDMNALNAIHVHGATLLTNCVSGQA